MSRFVERYREVSRRAAEIFGAPVPALERLGTLLRLFPALVLPLEVRESAARLRRGARGGGDRTIARMLRTVARISRGGRPEWYVRGFVVSMVESAADLERAVRLARRALGGQPIPVIPLLETGGALENGAAIVESFLRLAPVRGALQREWNRRLEIMLGYSDSAKEIGAFPSRLLIAAALRRIDRLVRRRGYVPVFFHGTGGSVARGGGSVAEQTMWWPESARRHFKSTLQGEMVQRTFSAPEILRSQLEKLSARLARGGPETLRRPERRCLLEFGRRIEDEYRGRIASPAFREVVEQATPYPFLRWLKIGSRPARRRGPARVESLRAIPWVLCWTQTRVLFPAWWGVGAAWTATPPRERAVLRRLFRNHSLFTSYVKLLGFTLQKVELPIWRICLEKSALRPEAARRIAREFTGEYRAAVDFTRSVSGRANLLWFRPWLRTSIMLRSAMIHPLNLLQLQALRTRDLRLLRETVTGIASGMLTTG